MASNFKSPIEELVDRLFSELEAKYDECCDNPVTGGGFVWGIDPIEPQKKAAIEALRAREWFAVNGPPDAPPLPLTQNDVEDYRNARGLTGLVGFYARSLYRQGCGRQRYDVHTHPSFYDFACGLMAINTGLWRIEKDQSLQNRFPPRRLKGMTRSAYWDPAEEARYYEHLLSSSEMYSRTVH
jgi:hypothetical protein